MDEAGVRDGCEEGHICTLMTHHSTTATDNVDLDIDMDMDIAGEGRLWKVGQVEINAGLLYFVLSAFAICTVTMAAVVNLSLGKNVELWFSALTFVLGLIVPQPQIPEVRPKTSPTTSV